jgi:hypothetical protein
MKAEHFHRIQWALCCIASAALTPSSRAQGYVIFNNRIPGQLIAPIFGGEPADPALFLQGNPTNGLPVGTTVYHGSLLEGTGFTAQLWAGPVGYPESQLLPIATTTFLTGSGAGFVQPPASPAVVPNVAPGGQAAIQWRVWKNVGGTVTSWASMLAAGSVPRGVSAVFNVTVGSTPTTAASISGLRSFNITCLSCGTRPALYPQMPDVNAVGGETVTFNLNAFGELPVTYNWMFNGAPVQSTPSITQVTSGSGGIQFLSLIISNVQPIHAGQYSLLASNDFGVNLSSNATLTLYPPPYLDSPRLTTDGRFSLVLMGAPSRNYSLETSSDLSFWSPRATLTNLSGQVSFTETNPALDPNRFFRARVLP